MSTEPSPDKRLRPSGRRHRAVAAAGLALVLATAGCTASLRSERASTRTPAADVNTGRSDTSGTAASDSGSSGSSSSSRTRPDRSPNTTGSDSSTSDTSPTTNPKGNAADGTLVVADECKAGPGKTIEQEPDTLIEAHVQEATHIDSTTVGGHKVPGFTVGAFKTPEQVVDGGCVIRYDAPGGCLGRVDITAIRIPPMSIPGFKIPSLDIGGKHVNGETINGDSVSGDQASAQTTPQVCRPAPKPGDTSIEALSRPAVSRPAASRAALSRAAGSRPAETINGDYLDSVYVDAAYIDAVYVDAVYVDAVYLDAIELPDAGNTQKYGNDNTTSYFASTDVLFDFGKADLKPDAVQSLQAVADDLKKNYPDGPVKVDGHTDAIGDDASNQTLSEQRAEAVKRFLATAGGIDTGRIVATGYGEKVPIEPNENPDGSDNPDGRAKNRRVIITATKS